MDMGTNNMIIVSRKPTHPGEMLREEFFPEFGLSVSRVAELLHVSRQSVNELIRERRSVSAEIAVRLARLFETTPPNIGLICSETSTFGIRLIYMVMICQR